MQKVNGLEEALRSQQIFPEEKKEIEPRHVIEEARPSKQSVDEAVVQAIGSLREKVKV